MRRTESRTIGAALALALGGLTACHDELPTGVDAAAIRPSFDVEAPATRSLPLAVGEELVPWRPPVNANSGVFLLPKACDVLIADAPEPGEPGEPLAVEGSLYRYQLLVDVPQSATIKLVDPSSAEYRRWESTGSGPLPEGVELDSIEVDADGHAQFVCNAEDPLAPGWRVVDPLTDHAVKGAGPVMMGAINTLNLNGFGVRLAATGRVSGVAYADLEPRIGMVDEDRDGVADVDENGVRLPGEPYDNMGIVIMGSNNRLMNSSDQVALVNGGWGHAIELEGDAGSITGKAPSAGSILDGTARFNIVVHGALGARLGTGNIVIRHVKAIENDLFEEDEDNPGGPPIPVGVAFELRRCQPGSTTMIRDSHFEGNGEAAILRECGLGSPNEDWGGDVTFQGNYVSSLSGVGLNTREVTGGLGSTIRIRNNAFVMSDGVRFGTHAIEWTRETTGLSITGNTVTGLGPGACAVFNEGRDTGGFPRAATLAAGNAFTNADGTPVTAAQLVACGIPVNGGTPGTPPPPPPPPPPNVPPTASISVTCTGMACTITLAAGDADGSIASYDLDFGDRTSTGVTAGAPPATVSRTYTSINVVTPKLTVTDDRGATAEATTGPISLTLNPADQMIAAISASCTAGACSFDASASNAVLAGATIVSYDWYYRAGTDADTHIRTTSGPTTSYNLAVNGGGFQPYRVRVKVTDSRGVSKFAAINNVTPIRLTVTKGTGPVTVAANRRTTLAWEGPATGNVSIFVGTPSEANLAWWGNRATVNADSQPSFLMPAIPRGVPHYYQVCLPNADRLPIFCSAQIMVQYP